MRWFAAGGTLSKLKDVMRRTDHKNHFDQKVLKNQK